jgi:GH25 family lysozyme M1 (1,4-beta-N-acetylmuramidase)
MAATARSARRLRRRILAAGALLTAAAVLTLDQVAAPGPADEALGAGVGAAGGTNASPAAAASWARTASGKLVPVTPTHYDTPVHPELLTHPDADTMGGYERAQAALAAATKPLAGGPVRQDVVPNPISPDSAVPQLPGIDVSSHQGAINWANVASHVDFVYTKATEGTYYQNTNFSNQYNGPYSYGVIRGAYHFAIPSNSSGTAQADYFVAHGGAWSSDGLTLPGALDIEYNPYGTAACYGLTPAQMTAWITNFVTEYAAKEHAYPVIYSTTNWWTTCTGNSGAFAALDPLWVANYGVAGGGPRPNGWDYYTFWQYSDSGKLPGDQDVFNGALSQLKTLAANG